MDDSSQFMQWALSTLQQELPLPSTPAPAAAYDNCGCDTVSQFPVLEYSVSVDSLVPGDPPAREGQPNSVAAMAEGGVPQMTQQGPLSTPTRRASAKISASSSSAPYSQDHIIAERKRREKINQRLIELSTVIPGLKKMDKATILSDATRYVRELQEKLKALQEDGGGGKGRSMESAVLVKKPCLHAGAAAEADDAGSPLSASSGTPPERKQLREIEARFSEKSVMVRITCENGKGVAVKVLTKVEELRLSIIHVNVMPFPAGTLIITITAKVEEGFAVTAEEIVGRLNSALLQQHNSNCNGSDEETEN